VELIAQQDAGIAAVLADLLKEAAALVWRNFYQLTQLVQHGTHIFNVSRRDFKGVIAVVTREHLAVSIQDFASPGRYRHHSYAVLVSPGRQALVAMHL